jgi:hypothetical protein
LQLTGTKRDREARLNRGRKVWYFVGELAGLFGLVIGRYYVTDPCAHGIEELGPVVIELGFDLANEAFALCTC